MYEIEYICTQKETKDTRKAINTDILSILIKKELLIIPNFIHSFTFKI